MSFLIADWTHSLVHLGAILYLVCFAFRNQVALRLFAMAGDVVYTAYYFVVADPPLWEAMFWSTANVAVNMIMLYLIFRDRQPGRMSDDELRLFRKLDTLSPGEFRRLVAAGTWRRVDTSTRLTDEGKQLDRLFYVLDGTPRIDKAGRSIEVLRRRLHRRGRLFEEAAGNGECRCRAGRALHRMDACGARPLEAAPRRL